MNFKLDTPIRRIAFAIGISVLLHIMVLWGPTIQLPKFKSSLPTLVAKLETLPAAPAKHKTKHKTKPAIPKVAPAPTAIPEITPKPPDLPQEIKPAAASAPPETETLATDSNNTSVRPPLPKHAQITFAINKGTSNFRVGETIHTLDITEGRYVIQAKTTTVGIARLFKSYDLSQISSGSYSKYGLLPDQFTEERVDRLGSQRSTVEFDHANHRARFLHGGEVELPTETQDILSVLYQFPPLKDVEITTVSVSNGKKIEHYEFEIANDLEIDTPLGKLLTVRLRKKHGLNEEGLEIWLAREFRLFPVKLRFIEKNGEITGEAVISDIRVSEEEGVRKDVAN